MSAAMPEVIIDLGFSVTSAAMPKVIIDSRI